MIKIFLSEKLKYMAYVMPEKMKIKPACTLSASVSLQNNNNKQNKQTKIKTKTNKTQNKQTSKLLLLF